MSQPQPAECTTCYGENSSCCSACRGTGTQPAPLDLDAIQARCDAATDGEWAIEWDTDDVEDTPFPVSLGPIAYLEHHGERAEADAQFIAHSRADVSALLAEVRRLQAAIDAVLALPYATDEQMEPEDYQQTTGRDSAIARIRLLLGQPAT